MTSEPVSDRAAPDELKSKFGADAETYARVRAQTSAKAGRRTAARQWAIKADLLARDAARGPAE